MSVTNNRYRIQLRSEYLKNKRERATIFVSSRCSSLLFKIVKNNLIVFGIIFML